MDEFDRLVAPMEHDDINEFVLLGDNDEIPLEEVVSEEIPSTLAGDIAFRVQRSEIYACQRSCNNEPMRKSS